MMLSVRLPCLHHCRCPGFPQGSRRWSLLTARPCSQRSDRLANILRTPHDTDDSTCASHGPSVHDFAHASRDSDIPALLTPPSGCAGATDTVSTSAVTASKGHTCGTSDQPSSNDRAGEAGLLAVGRQTHLVGHLVVAALSGAQFHLCCPRRPILVLCHGGRIC
jgi:hypothetical protein